MASGLVTRFRLVESWEVRYLTSVGWGSDWAWHPAFHLIPTNAPPHPPTVPSGYLDRWQSTYHYVEPDVTPLTTQQPPSRVAEKVVRKILNTRIQSSIYNRRSWGTKSGILPRRIAPRIAFGIVWSHSIFVQTEGTIKIPTMAISKIHARSVYDSRGNPTVCW